MRNLTLAAVCALAVSACATNTSNNRAQSSAAPSAQKVQAGQADSDLRYDPASQVKPIYPGFDAVYGVEGIAVVMALVKPDGRVAGIKVEESTGDRQLDQAAINAVSQWRFFPERKNGVAVAGYARMPISFDVQHYPAPGAWPASYIHPHYVLDTHPIPYASVDDALLAVSTTAGTPMPISAGRESRTFIIRNKDGTVREWWIFTDMDTEDATALRYVFTSTGSPPAAEIAVSSLCRSGASFCDSRNQWLLKGPVFARGRQAGAD
jgi:TonB family protein